MYSRRFLLNMPFVQFIAFGFVQPIALSRHMKPNRSHIMNGELTSIKKIPYQVQLIEKSIRINESSLICGGSILTPRLILTAAHCVVSWKNHSFDLLVAIGSGSLYQLLKNPSKLYTISSAAIYPSYHSNGLAAFGDFAILSLAKPLNMSQPGYKAQTVCLADRSYVGKNAIVSGFGDLPEDAQYLRSVEIPIVTNDQCKEAFDKLNKNKLIIDDSMLCAGSLENNKGVSSGDSGGPLVVKENGWFVQVGVVSWGHFVGKGFDLPDLHGAYSVFANISCARDWIESIIKSSG